MTHLGVCHLLLTLCPQQWVGIGLEGFLSFSFASFEKASCYAIQGAMEKALWQRTMVGFWELTVASS